MSDLGFLETKAKHETFMDALVEVERSLEALESASTTDGSDLTLRPVKHLREYMRVHGEFYSRYPDFFASNFKNEAPADVAEWFASSASRPSLRVVARTVQPAEPSQLGHAERVLSLDLSPDGSLLATASADSTVRLWQAGSGDFIRSYRLPTRAVFTRFMEGGAKLLCVPEYGPIQVRDTASGAVLHSFGDLYHADSVVPVGASRLIVRDELWDVASGAQIGKVGDPGGEPPQITSPQGLWGVSRHLRVWNLRTGELSWEHEFPARGLAFVDDDTFVSGGSQLTFWAVWRPAPLRSIPVEGRVRSLAAEGQDVLVERGGSLYLLDLKSEKRLWRIEPEHEVILDVRGSPTGKVVVVSSAHGSARAGWRCALECFSWEKGALRWRMRIAQPFADLR
jgi:WD40 repeat protein